MPELITQAEFARRKDVPRQAVNKAIRAGRITKTPSGKIDWETQSVAWETNRRVEKDHGSRGVGAGGGQVKSSDYQLVLIAVKKIEFKHKELDYKIKIGELISKSNFDKRYLPGITLLKNHVMALPARYAHIMTAIFLRNDEKLSKSKSFHKVLAKRDVQQLTREINEALDSESRKIMQEIASAERA